MTTPAPGTKIGRSTRRLLVTVVVVAVLAGIGGFLLAELTWPR